MRIIENICLLLLSFYDSMGIFEILKSRKDPLVIKELNRLLSYKTRLALAIIEVDFLNNCVRTNVYPTSFWKSLRRSRIRPDANSLKRHALSLIDTLKSKMKLLDTAASHNMHVLDELSDEERLSFTDFMQSIADKETAKKQSKLNRTLDEKKEPQQSFPLEPERYVHNLSSVSLDKTQLEILSLGPKFCIPRRRPEQLEMEVQFEHLFNQTERLAPTSNEALEQFKSDLVHHCYHYRRTPFHHRGLISKKHIEALKSLRNNGDILITKPDKGSGIVILNKSDYLNKMHLILSDSSKFLRMTTEKDKTDSIEKQLTDCLKRIKEQGFMSDVQFENHRPTGTTIPRLYGLPKVHKSGCPIRPILDMNNSPYHAIAQWLADKLEPVRKHICKYSLHDTFEFIESIQGLQVKDKTMFSFDVVSLFTNVPLLETIDFICDFVDHNDIPIGLPRALLKELLLRCTFNVQFTFNGELYRQIDGVAMGSPLGPLLADIFMGKLESTTLSSAINNMHFYRRYVDDIFAVVDSHSDLDVLITDFNRAHNLIQFTSEAEDRNVFNFLDVSLKRREDGTLQRSVYRKSTWSGQYINFHSFTDLKIKRNLVRCLTFRARKICSEDTLQAELLFLAETLKRNGYPEQFIRKHSECSTSQTKIPTVPKKILYMQLPFRGDSLAAQLKMRLNKALERTFNAATLRIHFTSSPVLPLNSKDRFPVDNSFTVV